MLIRNNNLCITLFISFIFVVTFENIIYKNKGYYYSVGTRYVKLIVLRVLKNIGYF